MFEGGLTVKFNNIELERLESRSLMHPLRQRTKSRRLPLLSQHDSRSRKTHPNQNDTERTKRPPPSRLLIEKFRNRWTRKSSRNRRRPIDSERQHPVLQRRHIRQ